MKKMLVVAALAAAMVAPVMPVSAADAPAAKIPAVCFFLPLLPKCIAAWKDEGSSMMSGMKAMRK